ncbi:MAG TPA: DUF885 domain-containing protein [Sphingomonadaceae bacterium]|jgi:uncharacterized protein (DUF885 family)|nr:DUF885 domain-containing protein [Sphingomonadaceae bacterium]
MTRIALLLATCSLAACAAPGDIDAVATAADAQPAAAATPSAAVTPARDQAAELKALFAKSDADSLERNPIQRLFRGDTSRAADFGDYITDAYFDAERAAAQSELAALARIDREALSPTDRIAYDVFRYQQETGLRGYGPDILPLTVVRPIDHFSGFHTFFPDLSSGQSAAPYKTVADYEASLSRFTGFSTAMDRAIGRFREGMASGVVHPKLVVNNVIGQLDTLIKQGVEGSTYYMPIKTMPASFSAADKARLTAAYRQSLTRELIPAMTRMRDFLRTEYLPVARTSVGLGQMKGGPSLYNYMIQQSTTLPLTADYVHNLGLSEVARIRSDMEKVKAEVGFKGTLKAFFDHIRSDPKFKPKSKEALTRGYYDIGKRVDAKIATLFNTIPKTPLEIRPVPEFLEKNQAGAYYQQGTPDASRPGVFYFNTYDLPSRTTPGMETLYLHEAAPGHHFQISLAQENAALPNFMRFGGNTAFVEGWALYAEKLGPELGLFTDPYQRFGHYDDEMLRAMRLVVDTGLHAKGWTRDRAIDYMLANSAMGRTDATSEVERYIAIPSQALAYKIGQLKILELRAKARAALGQRFDIRGFHAQVLDTGALPLPVLEKKIDDWIASQRG